MLHFFRKHQRFFFIFMTVIIVISFSFFGTFDTFLPKDIRPDSTLGSAIDGSPISQREVELMGRFLSTSDENQDLFQKGKMPNLMNDGVIQKDFLATGMGAFLSDRYFDHLKSDLEVRLKRIQAYKPYHHPQAPFLGAEMIWQHFIPGLLTDLNQIKNLKSEVTSATF